MFLSRLIIGILGYPQRRFLMSEMSEMSKRVRPSGSPSPSCLA